MEAISRTKRLLPQKRKNQKIREPLVLKGSLEIICDSSIKLRGKPVPATLSSVTIIDDNSAKADALCTALFVMGWSGAIEYLQKHPDLKAVLLSEDLKHVAMTNSDSKIVNIIDKDMTVDIIPPKGKIAFTEPNQN